MLVVKKDYYAPSHSEELNIPNLEVCCLMRTLKSKGFVTEVYGVYYMVYDMGTGCSVCLWMLMGVYDDV